MKVPAIYELKGEKTLADLLRLEAAAASPQQPRAKSVILLWLWGGPSHLDTFDMKPKAPLEYRGPFRPIPTNVPGIQVCEYLPQLAKMADKYAILRSMKGPAMASPGCRCSSVGLWAGSSARRLSKTSRTRLEEERENAVVSPPPF